MRVRFCAAWPKLFQCLTGTDLAQQKGSFLSDWKSARDHAEIAPRPGTPGNGVASTMDFVEGRDAGAKGALFRYD
jgi:hypothetical protein